MPQLLLAHSIRMIDFVSQDEERDFVKVLHGQERVELGFGLDEALVVFRVDEEDYARDFGEVVFPEAAG